MVYGGGASGVMLYGISLIAGKFDTGYLPSIAEKISSGGHFSDPAVMSCLPPRDWLRSRSAGPAMPSPRQLPE